MLVNGATGVEEEDEHAFLLGLLPLGLAWRIGSLLRPHAGLLLRLGHELAHPALVNGHNLLKSG